MDNNLHVFKKPNVTNFDSLHCELIVTIKITNLYIPSKVVCFLSLEMSLYFLECCINGATEHEVSGRGPDFFHSA